MRIETKLPVGIKVAGHALIGLQVGYWLGEAIGAGARGDRNQAFRASLKSFAALLELTPPGLVIGPYFDASMDDLFEGKGGKPCPNGCHEIGPQEHTPNFQIDPEAFRDVKATPPSEEWRDHIVIEPIEHD